METALRCETVGQATSRLDLDLISKALDTIKADSVGKNKRKGAYDFDQVLSILVRKYNLGYEDYTYLSFRDETGFPRVYALMNYLKDKTSSDDEYALRFYTKEKPKAKRVPKVKKEDIAVLDDEEPEEDVEEGEPEPEEKKPTAAEKKAAKAADKKKSRGKSSKTVSEEDQEDERSDGEDAGADDEGEDAGWNTCSAVIAKGKREGEICGRLNCKMHNRQKKS